MDKAKDFEKGWEEYKEKSKQEIKEMIGIIQNAVGGCAEHWAKLIAEELHKNRYRKKEIPENAVVLTREEYEKLKLFEERVRSGVCFTQKEWFDYCQKDSNERTSLLIKAKKDTRKETAKKLLDKIDYESNGQTKSITDLFRKKYGV